MLWLSLEASRGVVATAAVVGTVLRVVAMDDPQAVLAVVEEVVVGLALPAEVVVREAVAAHAHPVVVDADVNFTERLL